MKTLSWGSTRQTKCIWSSEHGSELIRRRARGVRRKASRAFAVGLMLALSACSNAIDIICYPAGQCPNTRSGHGGGY
jgi:hypothetical protein